MKSKKALSQVVSPILLILLTIVMVGTVWVTLDRFVISKLDSASSCYEMIDKIRLNSEYTCYNYSENKMQFSLEIKDVDVDSILISLSSLEDSITLRIYNESMEIENLTRMGSTSNNVSLPLKESAKTYILSNLTFIPIEIKVAPKVKTKQCDVADEIELIDYC